MKRIPLGASHVFMTMASSYCNQLGEAVQSIVKERCPMSGEFVRIYPEAGNAAGLWWIWRVGFICIAIGLAGKQRRPEWFLKHTEFGS